jgi:hypothetical protein
MCLVGVNRNGMRTATSAGLGFQLSSEDYQLMDVVDVVPDDWRTGFGQRLP